MTTIRIVIMITLMATAPLSVQATDMPDWIKPPTYDCKTCHAIDHKVLGPAWKDVAEKYKGNHGAKAKLIAEVKTGSTGVWGSAAMTAHPMMTQGQLDKVVSFVLSLEK